MCVKLWIVKITVFEEIKADDHANDNANDKKTNMKKKEVSNHGNLGMDSTR